jgi:hypothetical protein
MSLLLLVFGAVLAAAGVVLSASGVSIHDRVFDATLITPGIVSAVGGLLLVGLGLALRVLQRIEYVLAARPMPRTMRPGEASEVGALTDVANAPARIPVPSKIPHPRPASVAPSAPPELSDEKLPDEFPERLPAAMRFDNTRVVEELEFSLSPKAPSLSDEMAAEVNNVRAARRSNGAASARITPRFETSVRPPLAERQKGPAFDALWPKGARSGRPVQPAPPPPPAAAVPTIESEQNFEPVVDATQPTALDDEAQSVTVLKSGVVEGMAYTLYSDGSIEAALPQGRLRFGSITELRNHIEQSA